MRRRATLALVAAFVSAAPARAQVTTVQQFHIWGGLLGDYPIGQHVGLLQEVWLRRAEEGTTWQQIEVLHGLAWSLDSHWRVASGYTYVHNYSYGELPRPASDENRAWAQVSLAHGLGPLKISHRGRVEWRWFDTDGTKSENAHWRQQLRATYPLPRKSYAYGYGESFIRIHPVEDRYDLEQVRLSGGLGFPLAKATVLEVGYLQEHQRRAHEREYNNTLVVDLRAGWRLR